MYFLNYILVLPFFINNIADTITVVVCHHIHGTYKKLQLKFFSDSGPLDKVLSSGPWSSLCHLRENYCFRAHSSAKSIHSIQHIVIFILNCFLRLMCNKSTHFSILSIHTPFHTNRKWCNAWALQRQSNCDSLPLQTKL